MSALLELLQSDRVKAYLASVLIAIAAKYNFIIDMPTALMLVGGLMALIVAQTKRPLRSKGVVQ